MEPPPYCCTALHCRPAVTKQWPAELRLHRPPNPRGVSIELLGRTSLNTIAPRPCTCVLTPPPAAAAPLLGGAALAPQPGCFFAGAALLTTDIARPPHLELVALPAWLPLRGRGSCGSVPGPRCCRAAGAAPLHTDELSQLSAALSELPALESLPCALADPGRLPAAAGALELKGKRPAALAMLPSVSRRGLRQGLQGRRPVATREDSAKARQGGGGWWARAAYASMARDHLALAAPSGHTTQRLHTQGGMPVEAAQAACSCSLGLLLPEAQDLPPPPHAHSHPQCAPA